MHEVIDPLTLLLVAGGLRSSSPDSRLVCITTTPSRFINVHVELRGRETQVGGNQSGSWST